MVKLGGRDSSVSDIKPFRIGDTNIKVFCVGAYPYAARDTIELHLVFSGDQVKNVFPYGFRYNSFTIASNGEYIFVFDIGSMDKPLLKGNRYQDSKDRSFYRYVTSLREFSHQPELLKKGFGRTEIKNAMIEHNRLFVITSNVLRKINESAYPVTNQNNSHKIEIHDKEESEIERLKRLKAKINTMKLTNKEGICLSIDEDGFLEIEYSRTKSFKI